MKADEVVEKNNMNMLGRVFVTALVASATLAACGGGDGEGAMKNQQAGQGIAVGEPNGGVPVVSEYIKLAQEASCADTRNKLYVVDSKYVLWDRAGQCADNSYGQTLMGATPQAVLCTAGDSIAGPRTSCTDAAVRPLFDTMLKNLDKADLGLGAGHKVEAVSFLPRNGTPVAYRTVAAESFSNITTPREVVVKDAAAWNALWAEHRKTQGSVQAAAPEVDFSRNMLVAVFNGDINSGCQSFAVVHVGARNGKLLVEYELRDVSPVAICLPVVQQPMQVIAAPRVDAPVEFRKIVSDFVNFQTIDQTTRSNIQAPRKVVVRDAQAWATLWAEHAGPDAALPKIDFTKQMVIGVFAGGQPDGCRSTAIRAVGFGHGVGTLNGKLTVHHVDTVPGPGVVCTMAITHPAHLVSVNLSDAPVEFVQEVRALQ